jgi:hypothetical protein
MGGGAFADDVVRLGGRYSYTQDGQARKSGGVETGHLACFDLGYLILTMLIGKAWLWSGQGDVVRQITAYAMVSTLGSVSPHPLTRAHHRVSFVCA